MREINDGGTAFPSHWMDFQPTTGEQVIREQFPGMTLRDWFGGQALARIATEECDMDEKARWCYRLADAMIKERQKGPK